MIGGTVETSASFEARYAPLSYPTITHASDTEREAHVPGIARCAASSTFSPPLIHSKSRMRKSARTDLRGGRSAMVVPTATVIAKNGALNHRQLPSGCGHAL